MVEECKEMVNQAKQNEKEDPEKAIALYREAAQCFAKHDNDKHRKSNYERAAKLLRELGKSTENPQSAYSFYEQSASIFKQIDKEKDAEKNIREAQKKFVNVAKEIQSEARKMENIEEAEQKFALASKYYMQGGEEDDSKEPWIDSGDQFYKAADDSDHPLDALELFKHAAKNYRKGDSDDRALKALDEAGAKFYMKAEEIYKAKQDLVAAYYHYTQASSIYIHLGEVEKQVHVEEKAAEIREIIGMPAEAILNFLDSQGMKPVSILQEDKRPVFQSPSVDYDESEVSTMIEDEEIDEKPTEIEDEKDIAPKVSSTPFSSPESEPIETKPEPSPRIPVPPRQTSPAEPPEPELSFDPTPEVQDFDDMQQDLREAFQTEEDYTPDVSDVPKQEKPAEHLLDDSLSRAVEDLIPEMEEEMAKKAEQVASDFTPPIRGPIIDMLHAQGYISTNTPGKTDLKGVPEYEILSIIIQYHPISHQDIETMTDISSISMVLSNLTADGLIKQTNDYRYTITQIVEEGLKEQVSEEETSKEEDLGKIPDTNVEQKSDFEDRMIAALTKYGIISNPEISSTQLRGIAEFEIIKCLKNQGPSNLDVVKAEVKSIPSVQVTSIMSRLKTDGIISQTDDGNWHLTDSFLAEINP